MQTDLIPASLVVALGASGAYLLLPHKHGARKARNVHLVGAALSTAALLLFAPFWSPPRPLLFNGLFFYAFAFGSLTSAVLTVTSRDPIHSALWFAAVVLATTGLFLLAGAQFLAAGTVIVYAGAIIVTFLFVIMLAQMEGRAPYDRAARTPFRATLTCFMLFFAVLWSLFHIKAPAVAPLAGTGSDSRLLRIDQIASTSGPAAAAVIARADRSTARLEDEQGRPKPHVASLGETLYTDHLLVVELSGALLFVALIGALAIASPRAPIRPTGRTVEPTIV